LEIGKIRSGFRYVFPLALGGRHLGSVEVSVTFKSIIDALRELDRNGNTPMCSTTAVDTYLFPSSVGCTARQPSMTTTWWKTPNAVLPDSPAPLSHSATAKAYQCPARQEKGRAPGHARRPAR
jgi:hypothetical protein